MLKTLMWKKSNCTEQQKTNTVFNNEMTTYIAVFIKKIKTFNITGELFIISIY